MPVPATEMLDGLVVVCTRKGLVVLDAIAEEEVEIERKILVEKGSGESETQRRRAAVCVNTGGSELGADLEDGGGVVFMACPFKAGRRLPVRFCSNPAHRGKKKK